MAIYHSGEMDQYIALQSATTTDDGAGGQDVTWNTYASVWAKVRPLSGGEESEHDQVIAPGRLMFAIHNRTDLTVEHRVVWNGDNYNIRFIHTRGPRQWWVEFEAERGVAI